MKISYLRRLDRYLGFLCCIILFVFKRFSRKGIRSCGRQTDKILIIKFWGFGSIILAYDFFQVIRRKFPAAYICALTLKQNRQVFEMCSLFDEVIDVDIKNPLRLSTDLIGLIFSLRRRSFDISFDLEFTSRFSAIVSCLINADRRIGFKYAGIWRGDCFTDTLLFKETVKLKESFLGLAGLIGAGEGISKVAPEILQPFGLQDDLSAISKKKNYPRGQLNAGGRKEEAAVDALMEREALLNSGKIVLMNINASGLCLLRRWPKEYFVALADGLIRQYSAQIIFIGLPDDLAYVNNTAALIPAEIKSNVYNFAGKFSLMQLAYLIKKAKLFISNDSGPLHLAAYLGVPTVSFFGPETPVIYGPEGELDTVLYRNLNCSPCIRIKKYKSANCRHNQRCLRDIKPKEVLDEIRRKGIL